MRDGEVIDITTKFRPRDRATSRLAKAGVVLAMHVRVDAANPLDDKPNKLDDVAIERVEGIITSILDEMCDAGHEREAIFLFEICKNIASNGGSDAEIGHTAFEFIKLFPEVYEAIEMQAAADDIAFRSVGRDVSA